MSRNHADEAWKDVMKAFFRPMVAFFLPDLHEAADWNVPPRFLEDELRVDVPLGGRKGRVDLLASIRLRERASVGNELRLLLHVEAQGYAEADFPRRMFHYAARILREFDGPFAALAVLTTPVSASIGTRFDAGRFGTQLSYVYPVCRVSEQDEEALRTSDNVFAHVVAQAKGAFSCGDDESARKNFNLRTLRLLRDRGHGGDVLRAMYCFLEGTSPIRSAQLRREYDEEIRRIEEGSSMPFLMAIEREAKKKGLRKGLERGRREGRMEGRVEGRAEGIRVLLRRQLAARFGSERAQALAPLLEGASQESLEALAERIFDVSEREVAELLARRP